MRVSSASTCRAAGVYRVGGVLLLALATFLPALASKTEPTAEEVKAIIEKFAGQEAAFARAREAYTYRQSVRLEEFDTAGVSTGRYEVLSDIVFTADGKRTERVVRAPVMSLRQLILTPEDEQDLRSVQPFVLTTKELPEYQVDYLSKEQVDEIDCYVFAVKPRKLEPGKRYFQGIVWVDDQDLQIVKTYGRGTGYQKKNSDQQFPKFETYRDQIDGKYWFPVLTSADDVLQFEHGPVRLKMSVKYSEYKQFKSDIKITYGDEVDPNAASGSASSGPKLAPPLAPKPEAPPAPKKKP